MRTIKEAVEIFLPAFRCGCELNHIPCDEHSFITGWLTCAKEMQQWVDVNEELPLPNADGISDYVLVKSSWNDNCVPIVAALNYNFDKPFWITNSFEKLKGIVCWRPITRKLDEEK